MVDDGDDLAKSPSTSIPSSSSKDEIRAVAHKIAAQPAQISRPGVWGVLTAISEKARKRSQGLHILMHGNEHVLGRTVKETSCQFESPNVSGRHCRVYRKKSVLGNNEQSGGGCFFVFLKDSSSNGTYLNWEKLKKDTPEAQIQHGDIISLVNPPEHENAFAFVYREIKQGLPSSHQQNSVSNTSAKRKASLADADIFGEDFVGDGKRIKGLGIGGPEGPVSLDDVRRLQRSNEELRQQLEAHVLTIENLRTEARATAARHDNELKDLRESISVSFLEQIKELHHELAAKEKELAETAAISTQRQSCIEDLNQRLTASAQSRTDAEEIIQSQKATIAELEPQLEEERNQRRDERGKAEADLKAAIERVRSEALEELKRQSEAASRQQKEQLDVINKLQESDKENRMLMETLRSKLEDVRESLMKAEKKGRQLEAQLHEEEVALAVARKKAAEKEYEVQRVKKELESEKQAAREDAWAKVSTLELEMAAAIRDLGLEKQRLQGARERIVLRETQLRAFHSTAEEIAALQQKQQEQLNGMLRTLEDGENCELINVNDFETRRENLYGAVTKAREEIMCGNIETDGGCQSIRGEKEGSDQAGTLKKVDDLDCASDSSSVEKCNKRDRINGVEDWEDGDTQEVDHLNTLQTPKNLKHDTEAMDTALNQDDEYHMGTERLLATEAEATQLVESGSGGRRLELHTYCIRGEPATSRGNPRGREDDMVEDDRGEGDLGGETMQLEDEEQAPMDWGRTKLATENQGATLNINNGAEPEKIQFPGNQQQIIAPVPDHMDSGSREEGHTIATVDLLTSEVAGSWAVSTVASVRGDNESLRSDDRQPGTGRISDEGIHQDFDASQVGTSDNLRSRQDPQMSSFRCHDIEPEVAAGSQNSEAPRLVSRQSREHQALNEMLDIVAPDFRQLHGIGRNNDNAPDSEEDTEEEQEDSKEQDDDTEDDSGDPESE
eukprot:Gb_37853 [translate_table: standard]